MTTGPDELDNPQRSDKRRVVVNFVWYRVLVDIEAGGDNSLCGIARSCDVSAKGVGLYAPRPLPCGELIFLEIATRKGNLSGVGRIVHCTEVKPGYHRVGIRLEVVPPNDRPVLARILRDEP